VVVVQPRVTSACASAEGNISLRCRLGLRLELCGNALISSAALAAVLARWMGNVDHHYAALLGLSVTYALGITNELGWMVRQVRAASACSASAM
jgi:hypothetical protein